MNAKTMNKWLSQRRKRKKPEEAATHCGDKFAAEQ